ncbi:MAG: L-histidine N(alpha)-methyltransferase [Gammaproteobacteria bacterium]
MKTQPVLTYSEAATCFRNDVVRGLSAQPKHIPPKYFYDRRGSALFEDICRLPEYYLTRVETAILSRCAREIAKLTGPDSVLIELGSGASRKVRHLLETLRPPVYVAVDISREFLLESTRRLARDYPWLEVHTVYADLCAPFSVSGLAHEARRLAFYPGSSVGNFEPQEARAFLSRLRPLLGRDGALVIGVDLKKDPAILHAAYNDSAGVTAMFNLNLLARLRRELRAEVDITAFVHDAFYNQAAGRIEMHLVSRKPQRIRVDGVAFTFAEGETIHTESSYKYTPAEFHALAGAAGYRVERIWTDPEQMFGVLYLRVAIRATNSSIIPRIRTEIACV